jgi:hypothetical protein
MGEGQEKDIETLPPPPPPVGSHAQTDPDESTQKEQWWQTGADGSK